MSIFDPNFFISKTVEINDNEKRIKLPGLLTFSTGYFNVNEKRVIQLDPKKNSLSTEITGKIKLNDKPVRYEGLRKFAKIATYCTIVAPIVVFALNLLSTKVINQIVVKEISPKEIETEKSKIRNALKEQIRQNLRDLEVGDDLYVTCEEENLTNEIQIHISDELSKYEPQWREKLENIVRNLHFPNKISVRQEKNPWKVVIDSLYDEYTKKAEKYPSPKDYKVYLLFEANGGKIKGMVGLYDPSYSQFKKALFKEDLINNIKTISENNKKYSKDLKFNIDVVPS